MLPAQPPRKRKFIVANPDCGWFPFPHQAAAFEHADKHLADGGDASCWAVELSSTGRRSYVVASRADFWKRYRMLPPACRHHYEIIRNGEPCHLYFDLEYCLRANPHVDGERMVSTLCAEVKNALAITLGTDAPPSCRIVDLASCTPKKFSRHLIFRLTDGSAFADNLHAGRFVHSLCASLVGRRASEPNIAELFVLPPASSSSTAGCNAGGAAAGDECGAGAAAGGAAAIGTTTPPASRVCFVDLSVYSRNRCFRLYSSSKVGKTATLQPAGWSEEEVFTMPYAEEKGSQLRRGTNLAPPSRPCSLLLACYTRVLHAAAALTCPLFGSPCGRALHGISRDECDATRRTRARTPHTDRRGG